MMLFRHWKMIIGLIAIFGAGVGTGGVGTILLLQRVFSSPVATQRWADDKLADLDRKLKLSPEQKAKIRPIIVAAAERLKAIGGDAFDQIITTAEQAHADVAKELTPEQKIGFDKLRKQVINSLRELSQREISVKGSGKHSTSPQRPDTEIPAKVNQ
jgi:hypothetical protein